MQFLTLLLFDIVLGFVPQAMGCAVCLFAFANQPLRSKNFLFTSLIFSGIAFVVRIIFNYGLIDFGFHTVLIFLIFAVVAITYNKFPVLQSTVSIMLSGVLIVVAELITGGIITLIFALQELAPPEVSMADALKVGMDAFTAIMDDPATIDGKIVRALYGIPMNILFVAVALLVYYLVKRRRAKKA